MWFEKLDWIIYCLHESFKKFFMFFMYIKYGGGLIENRL